MTRAARTIAAWVVLAALYTIRAIAGREGA